MLRNYFIMAVRNLWKNRGFSAINIFGLAMGIACSLLIFLWIKDEKSVDAFHTKGPRIYSVYEKMYNQGKIDAWYCTPFPLAAELKRKIPEIEAASPLEWPETHVFSVGDKTLRTDGNYASADFFSIFSYPLLEGSAQQALATPESIAISRSMAVDFFGSPAAAMGKTLRFENSASYTVKTVFEDLDSHSSEHFNYIISWAAYERDYSWARTWDSNDPRTFIVLRPGANAALVEKKITRFLNNYNAGNNTGRRTELALQRFDEHYLQGNFKNGIPDGGRIAYVRLFALVALFILLIACINFMNLTTARSVKRAKEIGVRKVMGAVRALLVRQFIGEAVLVALLATALALLLTVLVLPLFNQLTGKHILLPYNEPLFWLNITGLAVVTGVLSGSYPAFFLSAFNPIRVLKGTMKFGSGSVWLRKGLVVFQFVLSIVLIISTLLISRQVSHLQTASLGFNRSNLLNIPLEGELEKKGDLFLTEARKMPGISHVTLMSEQPTSISHGIAGVSWMGKDPEAKPMFLHAAVGYDFVNTMQLQLAEGRDFSTAYPADSAAVIINETALALTGYKQPIGKPIMLGNTTFTIAGVLKDFHFQSLHNAIQPLLVHLARAQAYSTILVRTKPGETRQALHSLEQLCKSLNPAYPFTYNFVDETYGKLYASETIIGHLSIIFAILAVFISCLGLLGLSIFTAEQRTREMGIRKVLGAGTGSLFKLLSSDFLGLVAIAFVIAAPVGWWAMHQWLQQFAYKTEVSWWIFALAGLLALFIALLTVSIQSLKTALLNPVRSLRRE